MGSARSLPPVGGPTSVILTTLAALGVTSEPRPWCRKSHPCHGPLHPEGGRTSVRRKWAADSGGVGRPFRQIWTTRREESKQALDVRYLRASLAPGRRHSNREVRIPTKWPTHSEGSGPPIPSEVAQGLRDIGAERRWGGLRVCRDWEMGRVSSSPGAWKRPREGCGERGGRGGRGSRRRRWRHRRLRASARGGVGW